MPFVDGNFGKEHFKSCDHTCGKVLQVSMAQARMKNKIFCQEIDH